MLDYSVSVGLYINDSLTYPRLEYTKVIEQDGEEVEEVFDSFKIPLDIAKEVLELTATAAPSGAADAATAEPPLAESATQPKANPTEAARP